MDLKHIAFLSYYFASILQWYITDTKFVTICLNVLGLGAWKHLIDRMHLYMYYDPASSQANKNYNNPLLSSNKQIYKLSFSIEVIPCQSLKR